MFKNFFFFWGFRTPKTSVKQTKDLFEIAVSIITIFKNYVFLKFLLFKIIKHLVKYINFFLSNICYTKL
jgi:hypothetical protein